MVVNVDPARAPRRYGELQALLEAVRNALPADESDSVEWKSTLDVASHHGRVHIARAVLGFANRMPDVAVPTFEGHAFLLVGVAPGQLLDADMVDLAQVEQGVLPFLGEDGPRWRPQRVDLDGKHVLIVDVDAPRWGDPPYHARKSGEGIQDGRTFVRSVAETKPATSAQLRALQERLLRGHQKPALDVTVFVTRPSEVKPLNYSSDAWVTDERKRLTAPLWRDRNWSGRADVLGHVSRQLSSSAMGSYLAGLTTPESRTEAEYRAEVEQYLAVCEQRFAHVSEIAAARSLEPLVLTITNNSANNVPGFALELHVAGEVRGIRPNRPATDDDERFPNPPRVWGPQKSPLFGSTAFRMPSIPFSVPQALSRAPRPEIDNGGWVTVRFPPEHLRPHASVELDPIVLLVAEPPGSTLHATWEATSTGLDGRAAGGFEIPLGTHSVALLHRDDEDEDDD